MARAATIRMVRAAARQRRLVDTTTTSCSSAEEDHRVTAAMSAVAITLSCMSILSSSLEKRQQQPRLRPATTTQVAAATALEVQPNKKEQTRSHKPPIINNNATLQSFNITTKPIRLLYERYTMDWSTMLGRGSYGCVHMAHDNASARGVAVKRMEKGARNAEAFAREARTLLMVGRSHPNILELKDIYEDDDYYYLVMDLARGGEVYDDLVERGPYQEAEAAHLLQQVASVLDFLHQRVGIVHGDLKPENLLLDYAESSNASRLTCVNRLTARVKLIDFGCSTRTQHQNEDDEIPNESDGTSAYWPPERFDDSGNRSNTPEMDMWSLGITLYILLTNTHPFDRQGIATDEEIRQAICDLKEDDRIPLPSNLSPEVKQVLEGLLHVDPIKRLTAKELLQQPWVRKQQDIYIAPSVRPQQSNVIHSTETLAATL